MVLVQTLKSLELLGGRQQMFACVGRGLMHGLRSDAWAEV